MRKHRDEEKAEREELAELLKAAEEGGSGSWRTDWQRKRRKKKPERSPKLNYLIAILINLGLWYAADQRLFLKIPFITLDFEKVLPLFSFSLMGSVIANLLFLFYDGRNFRYFIQIGLNLIGMALLYQLSRVFPFALSAFRQPIEIGLILGIVALGVASLIKFISLLVGKDIE